MEKNSKPNHQETSALLKEIQTLQQELSKEKALRIKYEKSLFRP